MALRDLQRSIAAILKLVEIGGGVQKVGDADHSETWMTSPSTMLHDVQPRFKVHPI